MAILNRLAIGPGRINHFTRYGLGLVRMQGMLPMVRYSCLRAMLPTVEAALAAEGYTVERPLSREVGDERVLVMTQATAVVLLTESEQSEVADIEVYGSTQSAAATLLEQLPLRLTRQPAQHALTDRRK